MSLDNRNLNNIPTELIIINSLLDKNTSPNGLNTLINNNFNILLPLIYYPNSLILTN